jgi:preprotein translocase subunit SecB
MVTARKPPRATPSAAAAPEPKAAKASTVTTPAKAPKAAKTPKAPKVRIKLVRDGFTMPEGDFSLLADLKARALHGKREAKKSELLRAGLHALATLPAEALVQALDALQPVKVGRPKKA